MAKVNPRVEIMNQSAIDQIMKKRKKRNKKIDKMVAPGNKKTKTP